MVADPIAPGEVVAINGSNLGGPLLQADCVSHTPLLTTCNGVTVLVNGSAAPMMFDSATQIAFQVPFTLSGTSATIQVMTSPNGSTLSSAVVTVPVSATAPGLYTTNGTGSGTGYYFDASVTSLFSTPSPAVQVGDTVVLYGTGFGATNPTVVTGVLGPNTPAAVVASVTLTLNNQTVPATAELQPGNVSGASVGYDEVIFTVPSGLTIPAGQTSASFPMAVTLGGVASQAVNLIVAGPVPSITGIAPSPVPFSLCAQPILINGSGFQSGATVMLEQPNGQHSTLAAASVTFVSSSQLSVQVTVGTTAGTWAVLVTNPDGAESSVVSFTTAATTPTVTAVTTASTAETQIAQNTWLQVYGTNLSPATTSWSTLPASDFTTNLPTSLGCLSATVDGKPAAVYYISPTQVDILAPLDSATGTVSVQLTTPAGQTATNTVTEMPTSPAFFLLGDGVHVVAQHLNLSLVGPASLSPAGAYTPAAPGELVILWATGFGQTTPPIANQLTGSGPLPAFPTVTIGGLPATVEYAGVSGAGLYQLNVYVPAGAPAGDLSLLATYNGGSTQSNILITVQ